MLAEETELHAGGEAHIVRATAGDSDAEFEAYMFLRKNVKGVVFERWLHQYGCGKWFHAARNSTSHQIYGTYPAQSAEPPAALLETIAAAVSDSGITESGASAADESTNDS